MEYISNEQIRENKVNQFVSHRGGKSYPSHTIVHAKLEMTEPGDADELEADAVASEVINGGVIRREISQGGVSGGITMPANMEGVLSSMQGGGMAMPSGLKNMMENGFNRDFSQVRLHTGADATQASSSINAKAFTYGNDIYFNQGQFNPHTSEGQRLVAHELTHVVQGSGKVGRDIDENDNARDNQQLVSLILYGNGGIYQNTDRGWRQTHDVGEAYYKSAQSKAKKEKNEYTNINNIHILVYPIKTKTDFFEIIEKQDDNSIIRLNIYSHGVFDQIVIGGFDGNKQDIDIHEEDIRSHEDLLQKKINANATIKLWGCNMGNDSEGLSIAQILVDVINKPNVEVIASTSGTIFKPEKNGHHDHTYDGETLPNGGDWKTFKIKRTSDTRTLHPLLQSIIRLYGIY